MYERVGMKQAQFIQLIQAFRGVRPFKFYSCKVVDLPLAGEVSVFNSGVSHIASKCQKEAR